MNPVEESPAVVGDGVIGLPGIYSKGVNSIHRLEPPCEAKGMRYYRGAMPMRRVITSNWVTARKDANLILLQLEGRDIRVLVVHSRGSNVGVKVAEKYEFDLIVFIGAAIRRNYPVERFAGNPLIFNVFSRQDGWVKVGALLPFWIFGRAGSNGMTHPLVKNIQFEGGHGDYFESEQLDELVHLLYDPQNALELFRSKGRLFVGDPDVGSNGL